MQDTNLSKREVMNQFGGNIEKNENNENKQDNENNENKQDEDLDITNELDDQDPSDKDSDIYSDDDYNNIPQETYEYYNVENHGKKNKSTVSYANEHILQKTFNHLEKNKKYNVMISIYKVILSQHSPYIMYLMDQDDSAHFFPPISIQITDESSDMEDEFMEQIKKHVLEYFSFVITDPNMFENIFKGYWQISETDDLYFVFDFTHFEQPMDAKYTWATIFEIMNLQKIRTKPIRPSVFRFFENVFEIEGNMDMHHLKYLNEEYVKTPYVLYLCQYENEKYVNVYKETTEEEKDLIDIVTTRVNHPQIGNYFCFSSNPILFEESRTLKRFVVFIDQPDKKTFYTEFDEPDKLQDLYLDNEVEYTSIYFFDYKQDEIVNGNTEKGLQLWMIKSPLHFSEI